MALMIDELSGVAQNGGSGDVVFVVGRQAVERLEVAEELAGVSADGLGLAGIDLERAVAGVSAHHEEVHTLPGRDLSGVVTGKVDAASVTTPVYFMTEDNPSKGLTQVNILSGAAFEPFSGASNIESVVATLPSGPDGADELWKLNHYYERLDEFDQAHGLPTNPFAAPPAEAAWELHNLSADPEERRNRVKDDADVLRDLQGVLDAQRERKRRVPRMRNPSA